MCTLRKVQQSSWRVHEPKLVNRVKPCLPERSVFCFLHHTLSDVLEQVGLSAKAALNSRAQQVEQFPKGPDFRELVTSPKTGVFHKVCSLDWHFLVSLPFCVFSLYLSTLFFFFLLLIRGKQHLIAFEKKISDCTMKDGVLCLYLVLTTLETPKTS